MTTVATGHGGDCGGDPPGGSWQPPSMCQSSSKTRRKTTNEGLRKLWKKNGQRPLPIRFDIKQGTYRALGDNAGGFNNLIGAFVGDIPKYYNSWGDVPDHLKAPLWPELQTYFDMGPHLSGPHSTQIVAGINAQCASRFKDRKSRFKIKHFSDRGGYEHPDEIRNFPPEQMEIDEWHKYCDYFMQEGTMHRGVVNAANRAKQLYPSYHGSQAYVQIQDRRYDPTTGQFPSLIDQFGDMHRRNNVFANDIAARQYHEMEQLRNNQVGSSNPMTEEEILSQVLGERRGHSRGIGRKLPGSLSSSKSQSQ